MAPLTFTLVWDRDWKDTRNLRQGDGPHCEQSSQQPAGQGLCMHTLSHGRPVPNPHDTCMCTGYTGAPRRQHSAVLSPCPRLSQGRGASNRAALLVPPPAPLAHVGMARGLGPRRTLVRPLSSSHPMCAQTEGRRVLPSHALKPPLRRMGWGGGTQRGAREWPGKSSSSNPRCHCNRERTRF